MLRWMLLAADLVALCSTFALVAAYGELTGQDGSILNDAPLLAASVPLWNLFAYGHGLYHVDSRRAEHGVAEEVVPILHMTTLWAWVVVLAIWVTGVAQVPTDQIGLFWGLGMLFLLVFRACARAVARRRTAYLQNALVVGTGGEVVTIIRKILRHPEYGINVIACLDYSERESVQYFDQVPVLRGDIDVPKVIDTLEVDRVVLAWSTRYVEDSGDRFDLVRDLSDLNVHVDLVPSWFDMLGTKLELSEMEGTPLLTVPPVQLGRYSLLLKRGLDLGLSVAVLLLLLPLLVACALAITIESRGPVFFRQRRVGKDGKVFDLLKFRSMYTSAEAAKREVGALNFHGGATEVGMFKIREDPRVTHIGRWLRRTSIDELPQLVNIVRGDMSLVGPRPLIENEDRQVAGRYRRRSSLRPGLTGLWQVSGRSNIPFEGMVNLDYLYATTWSLWGDLKILMKTVSAVARGRGAY